MDEFRENGRLRGALDASLSGLNGDPYLARRLIAYAAVSYTHLDVYKRQGYTLHIDRAILL